MGPLLPVILIVAAVSALEGCSSTVHGEGYPDGGPDGDSDIGGDADGSVDGSDKPLDDGGAVDGDGILMFPDGGPDSMIDPDATLPDGGPDSGTDAMVMPGEGPGPEILRPDLGGIPLAPTRAFVRWASDPEAFTYQLCFTSDDTDDTFNDQDKCPNDSGSIDKTDAVINLEKDKTYRVKARFFRNDGSFSLFGATYTFTTDDSVTAWYKFDEDIGIGDTVTDSSGNNNHGVLVTNDASNTKSGSDILGRALICDGANDHVDLTAHVGEFAFDKSGEFSVAMRFMIANGEDGASNPSLFSMFSDAVWEPGLNQSIVTAGSDILWRSELRDDRWFENNAQRNSTPLNTQTFYHAVFNFFQWEFPAGVFIPRGQQYKDGTTISHTRFVPDGETLVGGDFDVAAICALIYTGSPTNHFNGTIDEVIIYKGRALEEEVVVNDDCAIESLLDNALLAVCTN